MIKMTPEELKHALREGTTFNQSIIVNDYFFFQGETDLKITLLPDNLFCKYLWLNNSLVTSLPNNLSCNYLWLYSSKISLLPNDLSVEILNISYSKIKYIPPTINKIKEIIVDDTFLLSIPYDSFLTCLYLFKNIITVVGHYKGFAIDQFEQRFLIRR